MGSLAIVGIITAELPSSDRPQVSTGDTQLAILHCIGDIDFGRWDGTCEVRKPSIWHGIHCVFRPSSLSSRATRLDPVLSINSLYSQLRQLAGSRAKSRASHPAKGRLADASSGPLPRQQLCEISWELLNTFPNSRLSRNSSNHRRATPFFLLLSIPIDLRPLPPAHNPYSFCPNIDRRETSIGSVVSQAQAPRLTPGPCATCLLLKSSGPPIDSHCLSTPALSSRFHPRTSISTSVFRCRHQRAVVAFSPFPRRTANSPLLP